MEEIRNVTPRYVQQRKNQQKMIKTILRVQLKMKITGTQNNMNNISGTKNCSIIFGHRFRLFSFASVHDCYERGYK